MKDDPHIKLKKKSLLQPIKKDALTNKVNFKVETPISISTTDLILAKDTIEAKGLNYVLDAVGFDVALPIEREVCEHRNRQGVIVKAELLLGVERTDKEWLAGDLCSDECKIAVRGDRSYMQEIYKLSRRMSC